MSHLRSQIFDAIKTVVATIPEFAGEGKVARGRNGPVRAEALPAITLSWADNDERAESRPFSTADGAHGYDRELPLSIIVHLRDEDPDGEFDRIATLIETGMAEDVALGGLAVEALLTSSRLFVDPQTGLALGAGRLVYTVHYKTPGADPTVTAL
ncbi:hypothetical protein [Hoeflea sp.]|uniref:hypothetical protein n=1 Tax=Hoeflea sp. TaxID=1940281 RepID=UPI0019CF34D0|nr:hypothetical protein [Hoeflea sp.]MBC7280035.1 hypothetical protein [Hoeflea sp.]